MRAALVLVLLLAACDSKKSTTPPSTTPPTGTPSPTDGDATSPAMQERLAADGQRTTVAGHSFTAPAGWTLTVRGAATILEAPEGGSYVALVDVTAADADAAVAAAWAAYKPAMQLPLKLKVAAADKDGWSQRQAFQYQISPNEKRDAAAEARRSETGWTVIIYDLALAVAEKRGSQVGLIVGRLLPKGRERESFKGKQAHPLDDARIAALAAFVEQAQQLTGVPGVAVGLIDHGKVVFAGGFGVRELGKPAKVDADTKFMIASNTKAMATLMLAKLVDDKKLAWDTPATSVMPTFKLGDAATTDKVQIKHLICACTGMPRQDLEMLLEWGKLTPESAMVSLAAMQPTSSFGELFQYSNPMAAAAGFLGGHVVHPKLELGAAYDRAMQELVFTPLQMKATTHDFKKAKRGDVAVPHSPDVDGKITRVHDDANNMVIGVRPAGGAWSTARDVLKYVQMELDEGKLPGGATYIGKEALLARRAPQVAIGTDATYGMGLMVDTTHDVTVVHHGGDVFGFHSDMMWLPEHGVGAVVLTNGDPGWLIRGSFRRKLLEVLFDGRPEADAQVAAGAKSFFDEIAAERELMTVPADPAEAARLAPRYRNAELGEIAVKIKDGRTSFDFGEFVSEVATRKNPDGSISFLTLIPGLVGFELVAGPDRTLVVRTPQHEYVFAAVG